MIRTLVRTLSAVALAAVALSAHATATDAHGTKLKFALTGWAYGNGNDVQISGYHDSSGNLADYHGTAGGFSATLGGAGALDAASFTTYAIELEEQFSFSLNKVPGYALVDGAAYFQSRRGDGNIADKLGRLLTFADDNPTLVHDASGSTSLQVAIWNLIYDSDYSVSALAGFNDVSPFKTQANLLLAGAEGVAASRFDVFALERAGSQDFLVVAPRSGVVPNADVPEPGSLVLAGLALAGVATARRRV